MQRLLNLLDNEKLLTLVNIALQFRGITGIVYWIHPNIYTNCHIPLIERQIFVRVFANDAAEYLEQRRIVSGHAHDKEVPDRLEVEALTHDLAANEHAT